MIDRSQFVGRVLRRGLWLAACALLTACATPPQGVTVVPPVATDASLRQNLPAPNIEQRKEPSYLIAANDELEIKFPDQPSLNEAVRVRPDGNISLQVIGTLRAEGLTPDALQAEMTRRLRELSQGAGAKEYLIRANDELEIKFVYRPELNERQQVRPDGRIALPIVNSVVAEGKTPEQLAAELRRLYAKTLRSPDLVVIVRGVSVQSYRLGGRNVRVGTDDLEPTVIVRTYAVPQVFVGGEVTRPGVMTYRRSLTLMQAIIEAGGNKASAEMTSVLVLRKSNAAQPLAIRRNLRADQDAEANATNDIMLEPFDVVILPKTISATIAELLEQAVFNILPPIKNSAFSFLYQVNRTETKFVP